jgi:DNA primase
MVGMMELAGTDTRLHKVSTNEYAGPCPRCGGTDRFHVHLSKRPGGGWMCRQCWDPRTNGKGWGDAIEYLRQIRGMSFRDARDSLQGSVGYDDRAEQSRQAHHSASEPPVQWQERASRLVQESIARLWGQEGEQSRAYLHSRGLTDDTIRKARLGYAVHTHPKTRQSVPCILFPWYGDSGTTLWRVQLRDIRAGIPRDERYFMVPGSSNAGLYLADSLNLKPRRDTVVMVEGEIDALTIAQEAGDRVGVVATGSTTGARTTKWLMRLARVPNLLIAFDRESKGDEAASYWLNNLPSNARRYRPTAHDVNEMLLQFYSVRGWIEAAIAQEVYTVPTPIGIHAEVYTVPTPVPDTPVPTQVPTPVPDIHDDLLFCEGCFAECTDTARYTYGGILCCERCYGVVQKDTTGKPQETHRLILGTRRIIAKGIMPASNKGGKIMLENRQTLEQYLQDRAGNQPA